MQNDKKEGQTKLTKKQEVIRLAWGDLYDKIKDRVDLSGWCRGDEYFNEIFTGCKLDLETFNNYDPHSCYWKSPKSLQGIENNNGWFSIEEHGLPIGTFEFLIHEDYRKKDEVTTKFLTINQALIDNKDMAWHVYSHYKPLTKQLLPLY